VVNIFFQNTYFVILFISLLIAIGLGALYSIHATRHKIIPSPPRRLRATYVRRRVLSIIGVILLILGLGCFVGMLLLRLARFGTLLNIWTLGFVIGCVLATCLLTGVGFYAARRSIRIFLERSEPLPSWNTKNGVIAVLLIVACCLFLLSGTVTMAMIPFIFGGFIMTGLALAVWLFFNKKI